MNKPPSPLTCFSLTVSEHVAHLVLNKPEVMNTMHPTFWQELDAVLDHLHKDNAARVLVISSTGKHFSAGMALETSAAPDGRPESEGGLRVRPDQRLQSTYQVETLRIPVIAAIQGGCIGGAVDMVTACCIRYATTDAFFCIQEINIGMVADVGTLQRLPKLVPLAVVKELAYTGRRLGAQKALGYGLVNEVFDSRNPAGRCLQCEKKLPPSRQWPSGALSRSSLCPTSVDDALKQMGWVQGVIWSNRHVRESVMAMKEKRTGEFPALTELRDFTGA
jgi:enoyl-CoA hydratase